MTLESCDFLRRYLQWPPRFGVAAGVTGSMIGRTGAGVIE
jgi:hypothetical protein